MEAKQVKLGLKENWRQFTLLVIINMFVGGMVGIERTIFPEFASKTFGIDSTTAILSFIVAFGISKAIANYYTGKLANRWGRRKLLILGWVFALPVPLLLIYAPSWNWVVLANIFLGINQGLAWSSTVVMKIDLVGEKDRGLAMGINEFSGYFAVGIVAFISGYIAQTYGIAPYPFYLGIVLSVLGLVFSIFWAKDTRDYVQKESKETKTKAQKNIFLVTTLKDKSLSAITQAGLVNNLNDGMLWGMLPILLFSFGFDTQKVGVVAAIYPMVWGIGQLFTGKMADIYPKKRMLFIGMLLEGIAILFLPITSDYTFLIILAVMIGIGTALVYPTFAAAIADATHPNQRAESIGVFRLWRDLGYAIGAIISGVVADLFGISAAIFIVGGITVLSAFIIQLRMPRGK